MGKWEKAEKTHAETEAGDERKGAATPNGNCRRVVFQADLCGYYVPTGLISASRKTKSTDWDETLKMGHGPLVVMYPESLSSKLSRNAYADKIGEGKHLRCEVDGGTVSPIGVGRPVR